MKFASVAIVIGVILMASQAQAVKEIKGVITGTTAALDDWKSISVEQKGIFYITMANMPRACGRGYPRVAIPTDHPLYDTLVTMANQAMHERAQVRMLILDSCKVRSNSWDFGVLDVSPGAA